MWDLIISVPDHCLSFYFSIFTRVSKNNNRYEIWKTSRFARVFCLYIQEESGA